MMRRIIYLSSSAGACSPDALEQILAISRMKNTANALTGVLLFHDGNFLQVLEGPAEAVGDCFRSILRDPRHAGLIKLIDEPVTARGFADWSMGYLPFGAVDKNQRQASFNINESTDRLRAAIGADPAIRVFVKTFLSGFGFESRLRGARAS